MTSTSEKLTLVIQEMEKIEELAASFQSGSPGHTEKLDLVKVTHLRETYLSWYGRCLQLLNDSGKTAFRKHYSSGYHSIHNYLAGPQETSYSSGGGYYGASRSRGYHWTHPFKESFQHPFNEQRLLLMRVRAVAQAREQSPAPPAPPAIDTIRLHTRVRAVSNQLFKDGHYRQAILQACLAFNQAVQERSGRSDLDGTKLMQQVFSKSDPVLRFDGHPDEQQGFMWLFSGVWMAIRNPRAHQLGETEDLDANEALELLAVVSACFRALDRATKV